MFTTESFSIFDALTLEDRMTLIRSEIQPIFRMLAKEVNAELESALTTPLFIHIAQHRRRTINPPAETWVALGGNKRGYKQFPHFQLGINENYLFMWLALIDQPTAKEQMAAYLLRSVERLQRLPADFYISLDHTKSDVTLLAEADLIAGLTRLKNVKKGEFLVGRLIERNAELLHDAEATKKYMLQTYMSLVPLYQGLLQAQTDK